MKYVIRGMKANEYKLLEDFLYEAIFIPEGSEAPSRCIINQPELQVYLSDFGRKDDHCLVAEVENKIVGAVWVRIMDDYGHVDNDTPSFAISLYREYRGHGIGTSLMQRMIELLKSEGYKKVSLSVQKENYAYQLYAKLGFTTIGENSDEYIMVKELN